MKTKFPFEIAGIGRVGVLSSLIVLACAGHSFGQEPLDLRGLKILRPADDSCVVTFDSEENQQVIVFSSTDLECWGYGGGCVEIDWGQYQFIDPAAAEEPKKFFKFETFNPAVPLPPQFEQLRMELGDESFAQWLERNVEETGSLSGVPEDQVGELSEEDYRAFEEQEGVLDRWLKDFHDDSSTEVPGLELPPLFEDVRVEWGDFDFAKLLVQNQDQWGNFQGVCPPIVFEWEEKQPEVFVVFQTDEQELSQWLDFYLDQLPPIILKEFEPQGKSLPPNFEQLRMELGDEGFSEWLRSNFETTGNYQGVPENLLPDERRLLEQFEGVEESLHCWLSEFEESRTR